jgi:hypothetical protein
MPSSPHDETTSTDYLRPVRIEGETFCACISFVPVSVMAVFLAAFTHALASGAACAWSPKACMSANSIPVSTTSFEFVLRNRTDLPNAHARQHAAASAARRMGIQLLGSSQFGSSRAGAVPIKNRGLGGNVSTSTVRSRGAAHNAMRILCISTDDANTLQMSVICDGFKALGMEVDARREKKMRMQRAHLKREKSTGGEQQLARITASHKTRPYTLVLVQLGSDATNGYYAQVLRGLHGLDRQYVACVQTASHPPVWAMWVPTFCGQAFVRKIAIWDAFL